MNSNRAAHRHFKLFNGDPARIPEVDWRTHITYVMGPGDLLLPGPVPRPMQIYTTFEEPGGKERPGLAPYDVRQPFGVEPKADDDQFCVQMVYAVCCSMRQMLSRVPVRESKPIGAEVGEGAVIQIRIDRSGKGGTYYHEIEQTLYLGEYLWWNGLQQQKVGTPINASHSADVLAYQFARIILDTLRPNYRHRAEKEGAAFLLAFPAIIAFFQRFSYENAVQETFLAVSTESDAGKRLKMVAEEWGYVEGATGPLQCRILPPDRIAGSLRDGSVRTLGSVFFTSIFHSFKRIFQEEVARVPDLYHSDARTEAALASGLARYFCEWCIRVLESCPSESLCFADFHRAVLTLSREEHPNHQWDCRRAWISALEEVFGRDREQGKFMPWVAQNDSVRVLVPIGKCWGQRRHSFYRRLEALGWEVRSPAALKTWIAHLGAFVRQMGILIRSLPASVSRWYDETFQPGLETWTLRIFLLVLVVPLLARLLPEQYDAVKDRDLTFEYDAPMQYRYGERLRRRAEAAGSPFSGLDLRHSAELAQRIQLGEQFPPQDSPLFAYLRKQLKKVHVDSVSRPHTTLSLSLNHAVDDPNLYRAAGFTYSSLTPSLQAEIRTAPRAGGSAISPTQRALHRRLLCQALPAYLGPPIAVLLVDDEAIRKTAALSTPSPISREYLAEILDHVGNEHPQVVGIDFQLDSHLSAKPDDLQKNRQLEGALGRLGAALPVVLANNLIELPGGEERRILPLSQFLEPWASSSGVPTVAPRLWTGHASVAGDLSQPVARSLDLLRSVQAPAGGGSRYSLSFAATLAALAAQPALVGGNGGTATWDEKSAEIAASKLSGGLLPSKSRMKDRMLIDFSTPPDMADSYSVFSTTQLTEGPSPDLKGKIVLIGAGYSRSTDQHKTPLSSPFLGVGKPQRERMFGVEVQANALATLLRTMRWNDQARAGSAEVSRQYQDYAPPQPVVAPGVWSVGCYLIVSILTAGLACLLMWYHPRPRLLLIIGAAFVYLYTVEGSFAAFQQDRRLLPLVQPLALFLVLLALISRWTRGRLATAQSSKTESPHLRDPISGGGIRR